MSSDNASGIAASRVSSIKMQLGDPLRNQTLDEQPSWNGPTTEETQYNILPQWHSQPTHLRVITVGAGAAGLLMAYKMKMNFTNYELVCYEK